MIRWRATFKACGVCFAAMGTLLFLAPNAEKFSGHKRYGPFSPIIIDGDTLAHQGRRFRLIGVDACEMGQPIRFQDHAEDLDCGFYARAFVEEFIGDQEVICFDQGTRSYERIVARCFVSTKWPTIRDDIGAFALYSGWAVPTKHAGDLFQLRYYWEYLTAKVARRGAWNGISELPEKWRLIQQRSGG